jgi:hypothetical protein
MRTALTLNNLVIEKEARRGRNAVIRGTGGDGKTPIRVYVRSRNGNWYLQGPVERSVDGVFLASAILGRDRKGAYLVIAIESKWPVPAVDETMIDTEAPRSNILRYIVTGKDL